MKVVDLKLVLVMIASLTIFNANALTINVTTEVGDFDALWSHTWLADSSDEAELGWVEAELGFAAGSLVFDSKVDTEETEWTQVDGFDTSYAFELLTDPEFYLIKIGTGNLPSGVSSHYLFENNDSFSYAVIDLMDICNTCSSPYEVNIGRISHIGEIGAASVPEPSTLGLFGIGLLGLAFGRKKSA